MRQRALSQRRPAWRAPHALAALLLAGAALGVATPAQAQSAGRTAVLGVATPAQAQSAGRTAVLGDGPPKGRPLSPPQLKACLDLQRQLEQEGAELQRDQAELDAARQAFERFDAQLQADRARLVATDKAAVDAYNARLDQRRQMVADYNARAPEYARQAQTTNGLRQTWSADCDDRPYDPDDYAAIFRAR